MDNEMSTAENVQEWIFLAEMDIKSAEYLLGMYPFPGEIICFHCQQSAEKILKGFLIFNKFMPPKTHELDKLYQLCEPFLTNKKDIWVEIDDLNQYSVLPRYPHELVFTKQIVKTSITNAKTIINYIKSFIPAEILDLKKYGF